MATDIKVPALGESVTEATVARWIKQAGETVAVDEPLVELETDKVTVEVPSPVAGTLAEVLVAEGDNVNVGAVLGRISAGAGAAAPTPAKQSPTQTASTAAAHDVVPPKESATQAPAAQSAQAKPAGEAMPLSPAVRKLVDDNKLDASSIPASGKDGRLTKGDVLGALETKPQQVQTQAAAPAQPAAPRAQDTRGEERVRMSRLRKRIAERLKQAQNNAAMLTTFNEADMTEVMALRDRYRDSFEKRHGVRLGFMSFFVKAAIVALKEIPAVNAEIDGDEIVYKNYYDIGVAVGTGQGLVVPVLRDADKIGFADVEKKIGELGRRARDGKLTIEELTGGTFTISNGGVYGSLMSTPILNPPQSGILGMHKIQQRPMVVGGKIEARPMMYLALSYDHRIIDGSEAVTFLVRMKECIENPERLLLDV
jgi:2-oxoglutarate dehydrogenase E2 component (dihydrolipoamide succinyltransferase)